MNQQTIHNDKIVDQFSQQAEAYNRLTRDGEDAERHADFLSLVQPRPDDVALDICCGPGVAALALAPHVGHMTGLDLTPAMLDQARLEQASKGITNVDWMQGDIGGLPFPDGAFSLVLCTTAFHHLTDHRAALAEMARVCRPGGRIIVRDVTPPAAGVQGYDAIETLRDPSHTHAMTLDEMSNLGRGLPLGDPVMLTSLAIDYPIEPIIAASFPEKCTRDELHAKYREEAETDRDNFGMNARLVGSEVRVSIPFTTARWIRR